MDNGKLTMEKSDIYSYRRTMTGESDNENDSDNYKAMNTVIMTVPVTDWEWQWEQQWKLSALGTIETLTETLRGKLKLTVPWITSGKTILKKYLIGLSSCHEENVYFPI